MHSNLLIVAILAVGFTLASFFAYVCRRAHLPAILGYLLAGYIIGPYSPGFVADSALAEQLAEIGVVLMLFGVGLHFKIEDLLRVKNIVIPGAIGQTLAATIFTILIVLGVGWSFDSGLIMGLAIGVASTVVLIRLLTDNDLLNTEKGHIAVGWLVVEDLFTIIILIMLPTLALLSSGVSLSLASVAGEVLFVMAKFIVLALLAFTWGHKIIVYILTNIARMRSQELFTVTILALVFLIALGSSVVFGTSIALGAFIAGMVIGKTNTRHQAAANALPIKDIFAVIFFLSVGMLFNPVAIASNFILFLGLISVILVVKPLTAFLITLFAGYSLNIALTVAISLAQIGEFSFILAEEAMHLKLLPDDGFDLLVACALISISINPLLFQTIGFVESFFQKFKPQTAFKPQIQEITPHSGLKMIVVGFGPIGRGVCKILEDLNVAPIIIEQNIDTVSVMEEHHSIIFGNAADAHILKSASIEKANYLFITIPDTPTIIQIIHAARHVNPDIQIVARVQYMAEGSELKELNVQSICEEKETLTAFTTTIYKLLKR